MDPSQQQNTGMGLGNQQPAAGNAAAPKEDYGDKAFDMLAKKAGHPIDRNTSEKITDGARNLFEKATGKHVPEKFSN